MIPHGMTPDLLKLIPKNNAYTREMSYYKNIPKKQIHAQSQQ